MPQRYPVCENGNIDTDITGARQSALPLRPNEAQHSHRQDSPYELKWSAYDKEIFQV